MLNLGVEGMMLIGAVTGFAVTYVTGSPWIGVLAAALAAMQPAPVAAADTTEGDTTDAATTDTAETAAEGAA